MVDHSMSDPADRSRDPHANVASTLMVNSPLSRRMLLGAGAAAGIAAAANAAQAQSRADVTRGETDGSASNPGPKDEALAKIMPDSVKPPVTDHGSVPQFWSSFALSHRRIEDGGWARQVNVKDFPISKTIASVNMRLTAGGVRELHWHEAAEWSLMLTGSARLTAIDYDGRPFVKDVKAGDLWYFPTGLPHSIQGLGPDGCEFLLVFDEGTFSEEDTTLLTDWVIHTPPGVVAKNFGVSEQTLEPLKTIPPNGRYIFQVPVPPPLQQEVAFENGRPQSTLDFTFDMLSRKPAKQDASGSIIIVDSSAFKVSKTIAMAHVTIKPGALREMHWHTNAAEWQYYISGKGRMTLFANHSDARTMDFTAGDVGYVPKTLPHYIENTGTEDLVYLEMFKAPNYTDISLNNWLANVPPELVAQHLGLSQEVIASFPKNNNGLLPRSA